MLSLKNKIFCKKFVLKFYFEIIISVRSTPLWEKIKDTDIPLSRLTTGSESGRPKNISIWIPNTASTYIFKKGLQITYFRLLLVEDIKVSLGSKFKAIVGSLSYPNA